MIAAVPSYMSHCASYVKGVPEKVMPRLSARGWQRRIGGGTR